MFDNLQLEFMRQQLHSDDSSIFLFEENDIDLTQLIEITDWFAVTKQYSVAIGAHVDRLTVKLDTPARVVAWRKADIVELRIVALRTRYTFESKADNPQSTLNFGFAEVRMTKNEKTVIV